MTRGESHGRGGQWDLTFLPRPDVHLYLQDVRLVFPHSVSSLESGHRQGQNHNKHQSSECIKERRPEHWGVPVQKALIRKEKPKTVNRIKSKNLCSSEDHFKDKRPLGGDSHMRERQGPGRRTPTSWSDSLMGKHTQNLQKRNPR